MSVLNDCDALLQAAEERFINPYASLFAAVEAAQEVADAANAAVANLGSDDILSAGGEKSMAAQQWLAIVDERAGLVAQAAGLGVATENYSSKYNDLHVYLNTTIKAFADLGADTPISGPVFRSYFANYNTAKLALLNAMIAAASAAPSLNMGIARNMLANSAPGNLAGYSVGYQGFPATGPFLAQGTHVYAQYAPNKSAVFIRGTGAVAAGVGADLLCGQQFRIVAGKRYEASVALSTHRCSGQIRVAWYDANSQHIRTDQGSTLASAFPTFATIPFPRSSVFAAAPANAVFALVFATLIGTGEVDPHLFASQWYFGEALPAQTVATQWVEGAPSDPRAIGYTGALDATNGAPAGTKVGNTAAETVEANANGAIKPQAGFNPNITGTNNSTVAPGAYNAIGFTVNPTGWTGSYAVSWSFERTGAGMPGVTLTLSANGDSGGVGGTPGNTATGTVYGRLICTITHSGGLTNIYPLDFSMTWGTA